MTLTAERPALWSAMPGWGIAADLTPRELRNARQLKVLRKAMAAGIALLLLACAGGYYLAAQENFSASADLATVTDRTVELQAAGTDFADVIAIQRSIVQAQNQISQVMGADVDLFGLMGQLQSNLPAGMTIGDVSIAISTAGVAGAVGAAGMFPTLPSCLESAPSRSMRRAGSWTMRPTTSIVSERSPG